MHWDVTGLAVGTDLFNGIDGSVRVVGAARVNTHSIVVDFALHIAQAHAEVLIIVDKPDINIEIFAGFDGGDMASPAHKEVGFGYSLFPSVLPHGQYRQEYGLSPPTRKHPNGLPILHKS